MEPNAVATFWSYVEKGGIIFLLVTNVWVMMKGYLIPKTTVEKMLEVGDKRAEIMATQITDGMQKAIENGVEIGVMRAIEKIDHPGNK